MKETALRYEIQIQSQLAPHRLRHFESLMIHQESSGDTMIVGFFRANARPAWAARRVAQSRCPVAAQR
jgi:hypothetical protein